MSKVIVIVDPDEVGDCARLHGIILIGAPRSTTAAEREVRSQRGRAGRISVRMDLKVDQEFPINGFAYTDERGNAVPKPETAVEVFTSSDPDAVAVVTADDGQLVARAVGAPGATATVHGESTWTGDDGATHTVTGDEGITLVVGDAERATIMFGDAREITPDTAVTDGAPT